MFTLFKNRCRSLIAMLSLWGVFSILTLTTACTTVPKVQEAELSSIRKVAIVGFTTYSEVPDELEAMGPKSMLGGVPNMNTFALQTETAANILRQFTADLERQLHWQILKPEQLISQDSYGDLYVSRMKNWKTMTTDNKKFQMHFVKNVLPAAESANFTPSVRDHLMNVLKVDALIEVQFRSQMKSTWWMGGLSDKYGQSRMIVAIYKRGQAQPVWEDPGAEGEQSTESISFLAGSYNLSQQAQLFKMYEEAAKLATVSLLNRRDLAAVKK